MIRRDSICVSGDKGGAMLVWDVNRAQLKHRFRAHPGEYGFYTVAKHSHIS